MEIPVFCPYLPSVSLPKVRIKKWKWKYWIKNVSMRKMCALLPYHPNGKRRIYTLITFTLCYALCSVLCTYYSSVNVCIWSSKQVDCVMCWRSVVQNCSLRLVDKTWTQIDLIGHHTISSCHGKTESLTDGSKRTKKEQTLSEYTQYWIAGFIVQTVLKNNEVPGWMTNYLRGLWSRQSPLNTRKKGNNVRF